MADVRAVWQDPLSTKGGEIVVSDTGVSVGTECCGCGSDELTDVEQIEDLRDGLSKLLDRLRGHRG